MADLFGGEGLGLGLGLGSGLGSALGLGLGLRLGLGLGLRGKWRLARRRDTHVPHQPADHGRVGGWQRRELRRRGAASPQAEAGLAGAVRAMLARADHAVAEHEGAERELALLAPHGELLCVAAGVDEAEPRE